MHNWRSNSAWNSQTTEARVRSTSVGATIHSKPRKNRHHLPAVEKNIGDSEGKGPAYGSWHGKNSGSFHTRENVDLIQFDYTNHRHTQNFAELDGFPTSTCSDSWSNCWSLCIENTNHQTSQPMKTKHKEWLLRRTKKFWVPPYFFEMKKCFVHGGDVWGASRYADLNDSQLVRD